MAVRLACLGSVDAGERRQHDNLSRHVYAKHMGASRGWNEVEAPRHGATGDGVVERQPIDREHVQGVYIGRECIASIASYCLNQYAEGSLHDSTY